ncbi:hypothetical protein Bca4012_083931 [Brassica carinata]
MKPRKSFCQSCSDGHRRSSRPPPSPSLPSAIARHHLHYHRFSDLSSPVSIFTGVATTTVMLATPLRSLEPSSFLRKVRPECGACICDSKSEVDSKFKSSWQLQWACWIFSQNFLFLERIFPFYSRGTVHEVLYLYYLAPLLSKPGFYHLRSRDGAPLVEEPSRGLRGNYPFGDDWDKQYVFARIPGLLSYPMFWRTVDVSRPVSFNGEAVVKLAMEILRRFRGVAFPMSKEALCHSRIWGNVMRLSMSGAYDEYQKGKTRKRRPFYVPPARLAKTVSRATGFSSSLPGDAEASPSQDLEAGVH